MTEPPAIVIEGLTKRYRARSERNLVPVPQLFRDRGRPGRGERIDSPIPDLELDDDDDTGIDALDEADAEEPEEDEDAEERSDEPVVALDEVSLSIAPGTALGVLGPNGSGKSTLLRIITRLTPPTAGTVSIRGRVASLIPSLPGLMLPRDSLRRNVIQVAQFYGIDREFAAARTDTVAEFAGLEGLLDQRVGSLSAGQLKRFGFAVTLLLDPDILVADDVIAVGDKGFQQQCMEHIRAETARGLTLLFASHRLDLVGDLCEEAILLDRGRIVERGPISGAVEAYESMSLETRPAEAGEGRGAARSQADAGPLRSAAAFSAAGDAVTGLQPSEAGLIEILIDVSEPEATIRCTLAFQSTDAVVRATQSTPFTASEPGQYVVSAYLPAGALGDGVYTVDVAADGYFAEGRQRLGRLRGAVDLEVYAIPDDEDLEDGPPVENASKRRLDLTWNVARVEENTSAQ
jgi:ABC-type polysaccharide/polyol phosphate transport system ATPase subunit